MKINKKILLVVFFISLLSITTSTLGVKPVPPVVTITNPTDGATVFDIIDITFTATDDGGIIYNYEIYIDDTLVSTTDSYSWDTTQVTNDQHTILCRAQDAKNWGEDSVTVTTDNGGAEPPVGPLKIMAYNIKESGESSTHPDWKEVVKEENADIIIFIETGYWDDNSDAKLIQYTDEFNTYFSSELSYDSYTLQGISYSTSGAAIMSRYPILSNTQIPIVPLDDSSSYDVTHDFLHSVVSINGTNINLIGSHLKAMTGIENEERREWEQEGIINYMDNLGNVPIMYMGDLNSFSPEDIGLNNLQTGLGYGPCTMLVDPLDPTYGQYSSEIHTFTDVHRTLNPTDLGISNPDYDSRIDFIYVNQQLESYIMASTTGDTNHALTGSDHLSVDVILDIGGSGGDYIAPSVTITNPSNNDIVSDIVSITVDATDVNGITSQRILIDDIEVSTTSSYSWDTTLESEGIHTVKAEATDPSDNTGYKQISVTVDNDGYVADPSSIMINELLPDPYSLYSEEWIELYNPLGEAIDISGCILDDLIGGGTSSYTIPGGTSVPANGFLVFYQGTTGIALNNDGDDCNFINTDGTTVIDTYTYSSSSDDVSYGRETDGSSIWTTFTTPTPGESNGGGSGATGDAVLINEILPDPLSLYTEEWIELYNPQDITADISGYVLDDIIGGGTTPYTIPGGTTIDPYSYIVFYQGTTNIALNNDGDTCNYLKPDGTTVLDSHIYSSSTDDVSIGRETDGSSTWVTFTTPTPGTSNSAGSGDAVLINEFLPDPFSLYTEEWIELYNPQDITADISGYVLDDIVGGGTSPYTIPDGTTIAPYSFIVFYQSTTNIGLNNDGDTCTYLKPDGITVLDSQTYSSSSDDVSKGRETDGSPIWTTFTTPTPGESNGETIPATMHVESIIMSSLVTGKTEHLYITVKIVDENNYPLLGVTVTGELELPSSIIVPFSGTTDANGEITFDYSVFKQLLASGIYTFTVTDVSFTGYTYDPIANLETSDIFEK